MVAEILLSGERMMGYEPVKGTIAPGRRAILKGPKGERVEVNCHPSNTQTVVEISLSDGTESRRVVIGKGETWTLFDQGISYMKTMSISHR